MTTTIDGWLDVYLTNGTRFDTTWPPGQTPTSHLYKNNHDGTFTDVTEKSGLARSGWQTGVGVGDYDNVGWDDLFCCFWGHNILFHNNGDGTFTDVMRKAGLYDEKVRWGSGCTWLDYDRGGRLDLFVCNYIKLDPAQTPVSEKAGILKLGQWKGIPVMCGPHFSSRGATLGDYDNDGDIDVLVLNLNDLPSLLRNDGGNQHNWIKIKLLGTQCNRTAIGARVRVVTGKHAQMDEVHNGSSVMSQSDLRLHFGLRKSELVDLIEVKWPTRQKIERFTQVEANQILTIREGSGIVDTFKPKTK